VCLSVLQFAAVCCSVLCDERRVPLSQVFPRGMCVAVCCRVLQCVAVCCSVLCGERRVPLSQVLSRGSVLQ